VRVMPPDGRNNRDGRKLFLGAAALGSNVTRQANEHHRNQFRSLLQR